MWRPVFELVRDDERPVFVQIAQAIAADIQRGRLRPHDPLPSTRALADQLATHRKTVTAAYRELALQGWIAITPARGASVIADVPVAARPPRTTVAQRAGFELPGLRARPAGIGRPPGTLLLLGGVPELRFVRQLALGRAYRGALAGRDATRLLDYADSQGEPQLRAALAGMLRHTRGLATSADTVAVVRGGQQALYLIARAVLRPGARIAVEALGYPAAWGAFRAAGATMVPIELDGDGLQPAALERAHATGALDAIYVTPHHQVPTTVTLTAPRRVRLLELARSWRIPIIEDDHDHEFQYDGPPVLPLAAADRHGVVIYIGTLAKLLAPGLRIGYVAATADVIHRITHYRELVDQQGDHVLERAIAGLIEDGSLARHARRARRAYRDRRNALCTALTRALPELQFAVPHGGMAIWAHAPGTDVEAWAGRARDAGVAFQPGARFALTGGARDRARIGFAACNERELVEAVRRMAATSPWRRR